MKKALLTILLMASMAQAQEIPVPTITLGAQEKILDFTTTPCGADDLADMPVTALRRSDNKVVVFAGNSQNYEIVGSSVETAQRTCRSMAQGAGNDNPAAYDDKLWLQAAYKTKLGATLGFVHHEYHGELRTPELCQKIDGKHQCWYGSTLVLSSADGGITFNRSPAYSPVLATPPYPYAVGVGRMGYSSPKVVRHFDPASNKFAVFVVATHGNTQSVTVSGASGTCLFVGTGINTANWRGWNGSSFSTITKDPYTAGAATSANLCEPVLGFNVMSVKYIPAKNVFIALGYQGGTDLVYAMSQNLTTWTTPILIKTVITHASWQATDYPTRPVYYHSLLDPDSASENFDTLEDRPYLYHVKFKTTDAAVEMDKRLLYRQAVTLTWPN